MVLRIKVLVDNSDYIPQINQEVENCLENFFIGFGYYFTIVAITIDLNQINFQYRNSNYQYFRKLEETILMIDIILKFIRLINQSHVTKFNHLGQNVHFVVMKGCIINHLGCKNAILIERQHYLLMHYEKGKLLTY